MNGIVFIANQQICFQIVFVINARNLTKRREMIDIKYQIAQKLNSKKR